LTTGVNLVREAHMSRLNNTEGARCQDQFGT
jgi:hypothetical protein